VRGRENERENKKIKKGGVEKRRRENKKKRNKTGRGNER
jgi:hypothetical protein